MGCAWNDIPRIRVKGVFDMEYTVQASSIAAMAVVALAGALIPAVMFLIGRKKLKADIKPFFIGCAVFAVFAILLEGIVNSLIFLSPVGAKIQSNIWIYGLMGGFMAGLFEETGRFVAFKTVLKRNQDKDANALMYGAGHGGFEVFFILFLSMVQYIVISILLNNGMAETITASIGDKAVLAQFTRIFETLSTTAPAQYFMSIVERIGAIALHLSLSVLVWFAAKNRKNFMLYPLALLLHMLVDAVAVILSRYIANLWAIEGIFYVTTGACVFLAAAVWKRRERI